MSIFVTVAHARTHMFFNYWLWYDMNIVLLLVSFSHWGCSFTYYGHVIFLCPAKHQAFCLDNWENYLSAWADLFFFSAGPISCLQHTPNTAEIHSLINIADEVASHLKTANLKIGHRSSTAAVINKINKSVTNRINNLSD